MQEYAYTSPWCRFVKTKDIMAEGEAALFHAIVEMVKKMGPWFLAAQQKWDVFHALPAPENYTTE